MPSMFGGDSTDREYAPHMWVKGPNGDWQFVGSMGEVSVEFRNGYLGKDQTRYHIGATVVGDIIADLVKVGAHRDSDDRFKHLPKRTHINVPADQLPHHVFEEGLVKSLDANLLSPDRQSLVSGLIRIGYPDFDGNLTYPVGTDFAEIFSTTEDIDEKMRAEREQIYGFIDELKATLGLGRVEA